MTTINQSSGQGALFELVSRGQKDRYFVRDTDDSTFPYDARYESSTHHLAERRQEVPLTSTNFGGAFEVEINAYGDVLTECLLEIDLPTWLPPLPISSTSIDQMYLPEVVNKLFPITTVPTVPTTVGTSYGYVNYVGYFLFEKIQFYQDQFLIQEWSGDGLLAKQIAEGSWNSSFLEQIKGGLVPQIDPTSSRPLQMRATPEHLQIKLPLPGMQCPEDPGLPLVAMSWQSLRIKGQLRKLEDLIVSSDPLANKITINNFLKTSRLFQCTYDDPTQPNNTYQFNSIPLAEIGQPTIFLSTIQYYLPPRVSQELRSTPIQIPFRRQFENNFTFGELDYISLDKGGTASVTRQLDGRHPTEKIFWFFRNQTALDSNRLDSFYNDYFDSHPATVTQPYTVPYGEFYYRIKLVIAGKDREDLLEPIMTNKVCQLMKDEKASGKQIGEMKWTVGAHYGTVYPAPRQPEGTVNFTTADRPTLYIELANVNASVLLAQRKTEMRVFTEGWNVYEIKEGRGRMLFSS
jgi:hypothetical protein